MIYVRFELFKKWDKKVLHGQKVLNRQWYVFMTRWLSAAHGTKLRQQETDWSVEKLCISISAGIKLTGKPVRMIP